VQAQSIEGLHNWIEAIRTFPKPVIAAVEGAAAGAGLLAGAGLRPDRGRTRRGVCHGLQQRGLSPDGGGSWSLAHALPRQLATELLMCGERIGASACMRWAWSTA
jgi:enoyl-CoA hydratase/carnithine racemase